MKQRADIEIRPPSLPEDTEAIEAIEQACFSDPWSRAGIEAQLSNKYGMSVVAALDGKPIGYVMGIALYETCEIVNVAVDPDFRRQGAARLMMSGFLDACRGKDVRQVLLEVRESNMAAIGLYESFGFRAYGKRKDYYENPAEDAVLMVVELC